MHKSIFCFICKKSVEVNDGKAIAKLCEEHDTPENREDMLNTPTRQLLGIQDEGLQLLVKNTQIETQTDMDSILKAISDLKVRIDALPTETTIIQEPAPTNMQSGEVNDWGEII